MGCLILAHEPTGGREGCSGSMILDANVSRKIATINEVSDDQEATFFFSRV